MLEEILFVSDSNDEYQPKEKVTSPTGANSSSENESGIFNETSRLQVLEQEQENLNASLMALTTHFAQVQFRLKQIVAAPNEDKEKLLKELEEFAFRGCPDLNNKNYLIELPDHEQIIEEQRVKQKELIDQLKSQLEDLESYAYQSGNIELPSTLVMEKHKVIIDELKEKINLPIDNLNKLTNDELKVAVDSAISQIVNPVKIKEQLVSQLKTQIVDLERFIDFLQGEASSPGPYGQKAANCKCKNQSAFPIFNQPKSSDTNDKSNAEKPNLDFDKNNSHSNIDMLKRILTVMQMFAITQLTCGTKQFEKNSLKKSPNSHWGDLTAGLEMAISKVLKIYHNFMSHNRQNKLKFNSTESDEEQIIESPNDLIRAVRKDLACALRDLMQHGLVEINRGSSLVPFGCFVVRSKETQSQMHIWDLVMKYYDMKHGKEFTQSATNKLSQSFNLNVVNGKAITIKQALLNAINQILLIHKFDQSNKDSCFKAFVCLALNEKKLVLYLKQLLKTTLIIENYYQNWSYVKSTGFDDALKSLDQLKVINSNFPVEKSTRRKSNTNKDSIQ